MLALITWVSRLTVTLVIEGRVVIHLWYINKFLSKEPSSIYITDLLVIQVPLLAHMNYTALGQSLVTNRDHVTNGIMIKWHVLYLPLTPHLYHIPQTSTTFQWTKLPWFKENRKVFLQNMIIIMVTIIISIIIQCSWTIHCKGISVNYFMGLKPRQSVYSILHKCLTQ